MPWSHFHLGPALLLGMLVFPALNLPALLASSIIADLEPGYVLFSRVLELGTEEALYSHSAVPHHLFFHTLLGATIAGLGVAVGVWLLRRPIGEAMSVFRLNQKSSFGNIAFSSLIGAYSHIALDSVVHWDVKPFWPLTDWNPILYMFSLDIVTFFCSLCLILGMVLLVRMFFKNIQNKGILDKIRKLFC